MSLRPWRLGHSEHAEWLESALGKDILPFDSLPFENWGGFIRFASPGSRFLRYVLRLTISQANNYPMFQGMNLTAMT